MAVILSHHFSTTKYHVICIYQPPSCICCMLPWNASIRYIHNPYVSTSFGPTNLAMSAAWYPTLFPTFGRVFQQNTGFNLDSKRCKLSGTPVWTWWHHTNAWAHNSTLGRLVKGENEKACCTKRDGASMTRGTQLWYPKSTTTSLAACAGHQSPHQCMTACMVLYRQGDKRSSAAWSEILTKHDARLHRASRWLDAGAWLSIPL